MLTQKEISKLKRQYHYLPDFLKYNTMNTTREAADRYFEELIKNEEGAQKVVNRHYPRLKWHQIDDDRQVEHIWMYEVVLPWWESKKMEFKDSINWPQVMIEVTDEHCIAVLYLKEHKKELTPEQLEMMARPGGSMTFESEMTVDQIRAQFGDEAAEKAKSVLNSSTPISTEETDKMSPEENAAWDFMNSFKISNHGDGYDQQDIIKTWEAAAKWEASRHNSVAENLWQTLNALRISITVTDHNLIDPVFLQVLNLVDQCLIENKPEVL